MPLRIVSGIALLALGLPVLVPSPAAALDQWVFDLEGYPSRLAVFRVASGLYGAPPAAAGTGEVVVESHVLADGELVPLPVYPSDGAVAAETEVFWTVALESAVCPTHPPSSSIEVLFSGRELVAEWSSCHNPGPTDLRFRVTVVAVRAAGSVGVEDRGFGAVKSGYR